MKIDKSVLDGAKLLIKWKRKIPFTEAMTTHTLWLDTKGRIVYTFRKSHGHKKISMSDVSLAQEANLIKELLSGKDSNVTVVEIGEVIKHECQRDL